MAGASAAPASATWTRIPFASTKRCSTPSTIGISSAIRRNLFANGRHCATPYGISCRHMAKERLKSPRARLFVALDLPDRVRGGLEVWQARALTDPALRPVRREALHVTLCFLSYHPERAIESIASVVTGVAPRPIEIRRGPEPVPVPPRRARLFAVGGESPAASELQAELSGRLAAARFYKPEKREFWTHVTVARARSERGARARGGRGQALRGGSPPGAP